MKNEELRCGEVGGSVSKQVFVIAEAGVNHNGSVEMAKRLIDVAADAGADAIKFQTFTASKMISKYAEKANYQIQTTDASETQLQMVQRLELNEDAHYQLKEYCQRRNILFLSTPFDIESVDLLVEKMHVPLLKIPSGEITNAPLLLKAASSGLPLIVSTGMTTLGEVEQALGVIAFGYKRTGEHPSLEAFQQAYISEEGQALLAKNVTLLHCTTEYPTPYTDVNLRAMDTIKSAFGLPVGLSDHTEGITIPIAAVARGATVIEKHFTLDKNLPGPDHKASLEPDELRAMVQGIRQVEAAIGGPKKGPALSELKNKEIARKSLVAASEIKKGDLFSFENLTCKRPGNGISPMFFWEWIDKTAKRDYEKDEVIS